jgi:hypothetical protein
MGTCLQVQGALLYKKFNHSCLALQSISFHFPSAVAQGPLLAIDHYSDDK